VDKQKYISEPPPAVSVIMSFHNDADYIGSAIESILHQSFQDFEFLIFNDGSVDNSEKIVKSFKDPRIKLYKNNINRGLTSCLNQLLILSTGKFIARMDADDISFKDRLAIQTKEFDIDNQLVLLGSNAIQIDENDNDLGKWTFPSSNNEIKANLLFKTTFIHPTVMIKKSALTDNNITYNEQLKYSQDRELWFKLIPFGTMKNLSRPLLYYRRHTNQITLKKQDEQINSSAFINHEIWKQLGCDFSIEENYLLASFTRGYSTNLSADELQKLSNCLILLKNKAIESNKFDSIALEELFEWKWFELINNNKNLNFAHLRGYFQFNGKTKFWHFNRLLLKFLIKKLND